MIVLVGCSGSGKSTIAYHLFMNHNYKRIVSYTTRPPRCGEKDGYDYHFISKEEFLQKKERGFFAESAEYRGWYYGTAAEDCTDDKLAILTPHGLRQIKQLPNLNIVSFYIDVPRRDRLIKILERGDDIEEAKRRDASDVGQFDGLSDEVDFVISNPNYETGAEFIAKSIDFKYKALTNNPVEQPKKRLRILCDIDGVVDDLVEQITNKYNEAYNDNLTIEQITEYNMNLFTKPECEDVFEEFCTPELILNMNPIEGAVEAVTKLMEEHEFYFVTSTIPENVGYKNAWLKEFFPLYTEKMLVVTYDKSIVPGDILIDDYGENLNNNIGLNLLYNRPWNTGIQEKPNYKRVYNWEDIIEQINNYGG